MGIFNFLKPKPTLPGQSDHAAPDTRAGSNRFAVDPNAMFDIGATRTLDVLFQTQERDAAWLNAFYPAAWNASVSVPPICHFDGPDGMPYYRLNMPNPNTDFEAQSLSNLAATCVERNAGAAFFANANDPETAPQFVMSMGLLDSMLRYGSPGGDPVDCEDDLQMKARFSGSQQVLTASPSAEFLPAYTARALYRYMSRIWGISDPRVRLLIDPTLATSRNLVIGRKRSSFRSSEEVGDEMARLLWFMPPNRALILMPEDWSLSQMDQLGELGDVIFVADSR
jgi:hypothetical protein